jgi:hypothetical protein
VLRLSARFNGYSDRAEQQKRWHGRRGIVMPRSGWRRGELMQSTRVRWSTAPCPLGRKMTRAALAYGTARVDAANAGDVSPCRGRLCRRASLARTRGGLPSVGQRRRTMALQHNEWGEARSVTQASVDDAATTGNSRMIAGNGAAEVIRARR